MTQMAQIACQKFAPAMPSVVSISSGLFLLQLVLRAGLAPHFRLARASFKGRCWGWRSRKMVTIS